MSASTNKLVANGKKLAIPAAAVTGAFALGAVLFAGHTNYQPAFAALAPASTTEPGQNNALTQLDQDMENLAAHVTPSVVNVAVTSRAIDDDASDGGDGQQQGQGSPFSGLPPEFQRFFGGGNNGQFRMQPQQPQLQHGVGSGVIISPDGYIVTNNHVVAGATQIRVTLHDRRIFTGKVIGTDKATDLAVIKINATGLPAISWGDSARLEPGQTVLAFGSPFGYFQFSVTRGIISAINRQNPYSDDARNRGAFIQTDAAINPGNSGGPLVNTRGELIGINSSIITNSGQFSGVGFAIPSQIVRSTADQLIAHGKVDHGYLGISMNDVTPDNAHFFNLQDASGAIVAQVTPDSPAARGGLKQGDVIVKLNGNKMVDGGALQVTVGEMRPGTPITLGVLRNGQPVELHVTVGSLHPNTEVASNNGPAGQQGSNTGKLGLAVADLNGDARQQVNAPADLKGVVVEQVRPDSPADDAGLQPGDVILEVNRQPATSASAFVNQVHQSPVGKDLLLLVWSKGNASYRTLHAADQNG
jgi:serine protease Do